MQNRAMPLKAYSFLLPGPQVDLCKRLQFLWRAYNLGTLFVNIELHHLFSCHLTRVLDFQFHGNPIRVIDCGRIEPQVRVGEICIARPNPNGNKGVIFLAS